MCDLKFDFSDEANTVFYKPSANIACFDDKDAPKLKRAPGRSPLNPTPPEQKPQQPKQDDQGE